VFFSQINIVRRCIVLFLFKKKPDIVSEYCRRRKGLQVHSVGGGGADMVRFSCLSVRTVKLTLASNPHPFLFLRVSPPSCTVDGVYHGLLVFNCIADWSSNFN
jgi:N-methylhydantoinase A/oxoprolinase/acetone carboxylase beta subunit